MVGPVKSLFGVAGPNASLKDAGAGGGGGQFIRPLLMRIGSAGASTLVIPDGVSSISIVCVGGGGASVSGASITYTGFLASVTLEGTVLCSANGGQVIRNNSASKPWAAGGTGGVKDGGGDGGDGFNSGKSGASGGAGGYNGKGGSYYTQPVAGSGAGGASGLSNTVGVFVYGGSVGLFGLGSDGVNATSNLESGISGSGAESITPDLLIGGGVTAYNTPNLDATDRIAGAGGGELSWVRNKPVSSGQTLDLVSGERSIYSYERSIASCSAIAIFPGDVDFLAYGS